MRWIAIAAVCAACGGGAKKSTQPAGDSGAMPECYPFVKRDGVCLTSCDWHNTDKNDATDPNDDCAQEGWPQRCNADGTCTPEHPPMS
jgi:hypothetical protein